MQFLIPRLLRGFGCPTVTEETGKCRKCLQRLLAAAQREGERTPKAVWSTDTLWQLDTESSLQELVVEVSRRKLVLAARQAEVEYLPSRDIAQI